MTFHDAHQSACCARCGKVRPAPDKHSVERGFGLLAAPGKYWEMLCDDCWRGEVKSEQMEMFARR